MGRKGSLITSSPPLTGNNFLRINILIITKSRNPSLFLIPRTDYTPAGSPLGMRALEQIIVLSLWHSGPSSSWKESRLGNPAPTVGADKGKREVKLKQSSFKRKLYSLNPNIDNIMRQNLRGATRAGWTRVGEEPEIKFPAYTERS